jgi:hypothetical protein
VSPFDGFVRPYSANYHPPPTTSSKYGGKQIIYGPGHVMPVQSRDYRPILTRSGFSTHTTPQSATNFTMKKTSQHSDVIYQTKAKGMLYTYRHSFIVLVFVYSDITCIVLRHAALKKLKRTFRFVSAGSKYSADDDVSSRHLRCFTLTIGVFSSIFMQSRNNIRYYHRC